MSGADTANKRFCLCGQVQGVSEGVSALVIFKRG